MGFQGFLGSGILSKGTEYGDDPGHGRMEKNSVLEVERS